MSNRNTHTSDAHADDILESTAHNVGPNRVRNAIPLSSKRDRSVKSANAATDETDQSDEPDEASESAGQGESNAASDESDGLDDNDDPDQASESTRQGDSNAASDESDVPDEIDGDSSGPVDISNSLVPQPSKSCDFLALDAACALTHSTRPLSCIILSFALD